MTGAPRDEDALDDSTVRVPREDDTVAVSHDLPRSVDGHAAAADGGEPDEATVRSRRRSADAHTVADQEGMPSAEPGPRRHAAETDEDEPDDGSTVVARRESRRRAARDEPAVSPGLTPAPVAESSADDPPSPIGRTAQTPEQSSPVYAPRAPEPFIAVRSAPQPRPPQAPADVRGATLSGRRRARRLAVVAVVAASFVVTVLLAALVAFTTTAGW